MLVNNFPMFEQTFRGRTFAVVAFDLFQARERLNNIWHADDLMLRVYAVEELAMTIAMFVVILDVGKTKNN